MMAEKKVLTPEVLPPEAQGASREPQPETPAPPRRLRPVMAGMLLDLVDFLTMGPVGFAAGLLVGGAVAFWIGSAYGLRNRDKWLLTLLSGAYCTLPFTAALPLGTLVGTYFELRGKRPAR